MRIKFIINCLAVLFLFLSCSNNSTNSTSLDEVRDSLNIIDKIRFTDIQKELTIEYCKINYGLSNYILDNPQMIVIHYTAVNDLKKTLEIFQKDHLSSNRNYISNFSPLNVGVHYLIDKDGSIYQTKPDSIIARHIIGFNHVAFGIENIALNSSDLTQKQLNSNTKLVRYLSLKYTSIEYLIGHHEYDDTSLPHYSLIKIINKDYLPYEKYDPGNIFMKKLRENLKKQYEIEFKK